MALGYKPLNDVSCQIIEIKDSFRPAKKQSSDVCSFFSCICHTSQIKLSSPVMLNILRLRLFGFKTSTQDQNQKTALQQHGVVKNMHEFQF